MPRRPRILVTLGDPCGISPELLLTTLRALNRWGEVLVVGARAGVDLLETGPARKVAWRWGEPAFPLLKVPGAATYGLWSNGAEPWTEASLLGYAGWIDPTPEIGKAALTLGEGSVFSGRCAVEAVRVGAQLMLAGEADALVTLPLSKAAAHQAGYPIPGHTEYLQQLTGSPITRMAFASPSLNVVLHTVHQSLRSVVDELDTNAVAETLTFAADRYIQLTGRMDLRVALCALNPHAGEGGAFGMEEDILREALTQAEAAFMQFQDGSGPFDHVPSPFQPGPLPEGWEIFPARSTSFSMSPSRSGIEVVHDEKQPTTPDHPSPRFFGPLPADSIFLRASRGEFDLVVALYHDQGLIPMKLLEPARSVNLTLGLPFIRTSPDHGTAMELAGRWMADPTNFLEATALAVRLAGRAQYEPWKADTQEAPH